MKSALSRGPPALMATSPSFRRGSRCSGFWTNSAPSGMTMCRRPAMGSGLREALGVPHVGPRVGFDVRLQLAEVVAVVVDPLLEQLPDGQPPDLGVNSAPGQILGPEGSHQGHAGFPEPG